MAYRIRAVRGEDWERLRELRLAALADPMASVAFNETYEMAVGQGSEFWRRRAAKGAEGGLAETFVAEDEVLCGRWAGSATVLDEGEAAHIVGVYLRPEYRGTGLAESLFRAMEGWASGRPYVVRMLLHVHEENPRAEALYRRIGYVRTGGFVEDPKVAGLREFEMIRALDGKCVGELRGEETDGVK
jgi:GNAT superfamily N-acetyltransferase